MKDISPSVWRNNTHVEHADEIRYGDAAIKATDVHVVLYAPGETRTAIVEEVFASMYHRDPGVIATIGSYRITPGTRRYSPPGGPHYPPGEYDYEPQIVTAVERWARLKLLMRERKNGQLEHE